VVWGFERSWGKLRGSGRVVGDRMGLHRWILGGKNRVSNFCVILLPHAALYRYADTNFPFALVVGVLGIVRLLTGTFYDDVTGLDVSCAYSQMEKVALDKGKLDDFRFLLHREIGRQYNLCKPGLRDPVLKRLGCIGVDENR
jgi:hypothetical protein